MNAVTPSARDVLDAASAIVAAFARTDTDGYFSGFASDATFLFHTEPERLDDRAAYERLWAQWLIEGWRVTSCLSTDQRVQTFPGGAVFTHTVQTSVQTSAGAESYRERETIVFAATDGDLIAVHEHLSPLPDAVTE